MVQLEQSVCSCTLRSLHMSTLDAKHIESLSVHMELVSHIEYFANGEKSKNSRRLCGKSTKPFLSGEHLANRAKSKDIMRKIQSEA